MGSSEMNIGLVIIALSGEGGGGIVRVQLCQLVQKRANLFCVRCMSFLSRM